MGEDLLNTVVATAGAAILVGEHAIAGWLLHRFLLDRAPGIGALIPRDGGAIIGFAAGFGTLWWRFGL